MTTASSGVDNTMPAQVVIDTDQEAGLAGRERWLSVILAVAAVAVGVWGLSGVDETTIDSTGLIGVIPLVTYAAIAALIGLFVLSLRRPDEDVVVLGFVSAGLVVLLHGAPAFIESAARFPVAWLHASFVDSIVSTGQLATHLDARFSWPGFFTGMAALTEAVGAPSASVWLAWAPIVIVLAYIPLLVGIGRATVASWRAIWTGVAVFLLADWVGQDYFAPQAATMLMYLAVTTLVLSFLRVAKHRGAAGASTASADAAAQGVEVSRPRAIIHRVRRAFAPDLDPPERPLHARTRIGLVLVIAAGILASVASHQLTPMMLVVTLGALALARRMRTWSLALFAVVATATWVCVIAETYWVGHPSGIFGSLGNVDEIARSGVAERVTGAAAHLVVVESRIGYSLLVWTLALGGVLLGLARGRVSLPLVLLACTPSLMIIAGSYGGEGFLRMYLFSLAGSSLLIGTLAWPHSTEPALSSRAGWLRPIAIGAGLVIAVPVFMLARYGNEAFERFSASELATTAAVADLVPPGSVVVTFAPGGGGNYTSNSIGITRGGRLIDPEDPTSLTQDGITRRVAALPDGTYVLILRSHVEFAEANYGLPSTTVSALVDQMQASKGVRVLFQDEDGAILERTRGDRNDS